MLSRLADMATNLTIERVLQTVGGLLLAIVTWIAASTLDDVRANRETLIAVKANRFTAEDGKQVWAEIAAIRSDLARLPQALQVAIDEHSKRPHIAAVPRDELNAILGGLDKRLARIETRLDRALDGK